MSNPNAVAETQAQEEKAPRRMADVLRAAREGYAATKAYSGKASLNNGDDLAKALAGQTPAQAIAAAQALMDEVAGGSSDTDLASKYAKLNAGQQRMNSGNRIRGMVKRGDVTKAAAIKAIKAAGKGA